MVTDAISADDGGLKASRPEQKLGLAINRVISSLKVAN